MKTNYQKFVEDEQSKRWCIGISIAAIVLPALVIILSVISKIA